MKYHFSKSVQVPIEQAVGNATKSLADRGFGVLTVIDVRATLKKKLDVECRPYTILGACNPRFAYQALVLEDRIGAMLPCNGIVQLGDDGMVEVSAVDPVASMQAIDNAELGAIANIAQELSREAVESL